MNEHFIYEDFLCCGDQRNEHFLYSKGKMHERTLGRAIVHMVNTQTSLKLSDKKTVHSWRHEYASLMDGLNSSQMSSEFISAVMDKPTSQLSIYMSGIKPVRILQKQRILYDILTLRHPAGGEFLGLTEEMVDEYRVIRDGHVVRESSSVKPGVVDVESSPQPSSLPTITPPPLPSFASMFAPSSPPLNAPQPMRESGGNVRPSSLGLSVVLRTFSFRAKFVLSEEEVRSLRNMLAESRNDATAKMNELGEAQTKILHLEGVLKEKIEEFEARAKKFLHRLNENAVEKRQLVLRTEKAEKNLKMMTDQFEEMRLSYDQKTAQVGQLSARKTNLLQEVTSLQNLLGERKAQISSLQSQVLSLQAQAVSAETELRLLK